MGGITMAELRHGLRRFVSPAVAIVLGVAFVAATITANATMERATEQAAAEQISGYSAVVSGSGGSAPGSVSGPADLGPKELAQVRDTPGVTRAAVEQTASVPIRAGSNEQGFLASTAADGLIHGISGRVSAGPGEVLLNTEAASSLGVRPGSTVTIGGSPGAAERLTVAGVVRVDGQSGMPFVVGTSRQISAWSGSRAYDAILVAGGEPEQLAESLRARLGDDVAVRTADDELGRRVADMVTGIRFITMFFAMFALVALFVAGMVIANTFQILLAQRARRLALLRCVGASRRQVTRAVIGESFVLGLAASALGVGLGFGLVAVFTRFGGAAEITQLPLNDVGVDVVGLLVAVAVGTAVTVLSALPPARRASRVTPLAALRPELAPSGRSRTSRVRLAIGFVVSAIGFAALLGGALAGQAPVSVGGGILSCLGVILTTPVTVPAIARRAGGILARICGVPGELATDNTIRNPRRTAATSTALLVGITLMASMLVGAATSKNAIQATVDEQFALDVQVTSGGPLPDGVRRQVSGIDGVEQDVTLRSSSVMVAGPDLRDEQDVVGVPASARSVLRDASALDGLREGVLLIGEATADEFGIAEGDRVPVGTGNLTAHLKKGDLSGVMVTASDLTRLVPEAEAATMWLRLSPDAEPGAVVGEVRNAVSPSGGQVGGAAGMRSEIDAMVRVMLLIVTALLGVAVLIALVGVGNTLGLSVLERQRETALLRALGFTARQVRRTLAIEALLVALVAAVAGSLLGVLYGWAGTRALLGGYAEGTLPQVPVGAMTLLVLAAAGCGLLASWAPARRAARTAPVAALAAE